MTMRSLIGVALIIVLTLQRVNLITGQGNNNNNNNNNDADSYNASLT